MLRLMNYCIHQGLVKNKTAWCEAVGFAHQNMTQIRNGQQAFGHDVILNAVKLAGSSADYVYGLTNVMKRPSEQMEPVDLIRMALSMLEHSSNTGGNTLRKSRSKNK
jgi:hypothetical protein